jgi:hypothetical protein
LAVILISAILFPETGASWGFCFRRESKLQRRQSEVKDKYVYTLSTGRLSYLKFYIQRLVKSLIEPQLN